MVHNTPVLWHSSHLSERRHAPLLVFCKFKIDSDESSNRSASGELLTLAWDPRLALSGWRRGRASVLKFEVSRGPGRPVEWIGFVPTAGLVHSPRCVFERAICLTGRLGSEPPTSSRTVGSTGASADRRTVSLEVAMMFQPACQGDVGGGSRAAGDVSRGMVHQDDARPKSLDHPPFHPDLRRIACEGGELVMHCLRARNLRLPRQDISVESRDAQPEVFLTVLPDGGEVETSTSYIGSGGRHPVWGQVTTMSGNHRQQYNWFRHVSPRSAVEFGALTPLAPQLPWHDDGSSIPTTAILPRFFHSLREYRENYPRYRLTIRLRCVAQSGETWHPFINLNEGIPPLPTTTRSSLRSSSDSYPIHRGRRHSSRCGAGEKRTSSLGRQRPWRSRTVLGGAHCSRTWRGRRRRPPRILRLPRASTRWVFVACEPGQGGRFSQTETCRQELRLRQRGSCVHGTTSQR